MEISQNNFSNNFGGHSVTTITARVSVAPGSSGGPLLDRSGRVVGVVSARAETVEWVSIGVAIAIAASEFWPTIRAFDPREADALGFLGDVPRRNPRESTPEPRHLAPREMVPSIRPPTDFELGELQEQKYECAQRLLLPPDAGYRTYPLNNSGVPKLLHFPAQFNRIQLAVITWPDRLRLTFSASRDGGKTFVCVLR